MQTKLKRNVNERHWSHKQASQKRNNLTESWGLFTVIGGEESEPPLHCSFNLKEDKVFTWRSVRVNGVSMRTGVWRCVCAPLSACKLSRHSLSCDSNQSTQSPSDLACVPSCWPSFTSSSLPSLWPMPHLSIRSPFFFSPLLDDYGNLLLAESLLEECLLENMALLRSSTPLMDDSLPKLATAKSHLNKILNRGRLEVRISHFCGWN